MVDDKEVEVLGDFAATLSLIEVGLGSFLHGFHVPFAGVFLSLNQGYLLVRASTDDRVPPRSWIPYQISNVAAVLKSFSPAGKKLGPMLSLSMQGLLFNIGTFIFGETLFGLSVGMVLLSFWGFCQPVLTYYLFFGADLFRALEYMLEKSLPYHHLSVHDLTLLLIGLIIIKALLGVLLVFFARNRKGIAFQKRLEEIGLGKLQQGTHIRGPLFVLVLRDLFRPLFLASLLMTGLFLYFTESEKAEIFWMMMRPVGIAFIFFYFSRTVTLERWLSHLEGGRGRSFALAAKKALSKIKRSE